MKLLSIVIMAHPKRAEFIPYLKKKLGDVPVIFDTKNNIWDTCRRAWLAQDMQCKYALVIQDDAIICDNFRERAEALLKDDFIYSFFAGQMLASRISHADRRGRDYVESGMIFNEVALCMKTEHIQDMVRFCDSREAQTDQEISNWARKNRISVRYPIPSLVDHRGDIESIYRRNYNVPKAEKPRTAFRYVDKR